MTSEDCLYEAENVYILLQLATQTKRNLKKDDIRNARGAVQFLLDAEEFSFADLSRYYLKSFSTYFS